MLISTEISSFKRYGNNEQILLLLKNAGFDAYDFTMGLATKECYIFDEDYIEKAKKLRKYADQIGIKCNQSHAPFPTIKPTSEEWALDLYKDISKSLNQPFPKGNNDKLEYDTLLKELTNRTLEISAILGAKYCIIHPFADFSPQQNAQLYMQFYALAKKLGVKIAVENMWNWNAQGTGASPASCSDPENYNAHLQLLDNEVFNACLDIGHAELKGLNTNSYQMIKQLGNRLKCLHIHDNNLINDEHLLPFTSKINFDRVTTALAEINYEGDITFEASSYIGKFDLSFYQIGAKYMRDIGQYLLDQINLKKTIL